MHILEEIKSIGQPHRSRSGTYIEFSTYHSGFIKNSLQYSQCVGRKCFHIPLQAYYTTFDHLDDQQKAWYFYWRSQVLQGNYLDTDMSYIFLFVYELINYSFNQNAAFNISMIVRLYESYKERHPKLEYYLLQWKEDFLHEIALAENKAVNRIEESSRFSIYEKVKEKEEQLHKVSFTLWKPYIADYRETQFFQQNKNKIYKVFKESLPLLQSSYASDQKKILEEWMPIKMKEETRYLFGGAVMGRKAREYKVQVAERMPTEKMYKQITALFRMSENVARTLAGEKRKIKVLVENLPEDMEEKMIEKFSQQNTTGSKQKSRFVKVQEKSEVAEGGIIPRRSEEEALPKLAIEFNIERIQQLDKESQELQQIFEERFTDHEEEEMVVASVKEKEAKEENSFILPLSVFDTDEEDGEGFLEELSEIEIEFLQGFKHLRRNAQEATRFLKGKGIMLGMFLDALNEKADEYLGDNLIEQDGDELEITEEYTYILAKLQEVTS
nr:TerB N-terminal domain-containing protein [Aneurinibacillus soli]